MSGHKAFFTRPVKLLSIFLLGFSAAGCGTMSGGQRRGDGATLRPGWARIARAAKHAISMPEVWAPAAAAVAIQAGGADKRLSNWASRKTPVFGSQAGAAKASNTLINISNDVFWASVVAAPGGPRLKEWLYSKSKTAAGGLAANAAAFQFTRTLQGITKRQRPNGAGRSSFPSLHTTYAASQTMSAYENIRSIGLTPGEAALARGALDSIPLAMAWARIEAKAHYPSDTLAAMSLSSFISAFMSEAFIGESPLSIELTGKTPMVTCRLAF